MEQQDLRNAGWVWIGFRFGVGFCLAVLILGVIGGVAAHVYRHHRNAAPAGPAAQQAPAQAHPAPPPSPPPAAKAPPPAGAAPAHKGQHIVVPPKDGKTCLQEAHGMIDDRYEACLKGQDYWTGDAVAGQPGDENAQADQQALDEWAVQLTFAVTRVWIVPPGTSPDLKATASIGLSPVGEVLSASIASGSGVAAFDESLLKAIYKASPLPLPASREAFMPTVSLCFSPDPKNCQ